MIARTIFWRKFKKLIFGSFAIVFGAITCCLLGSWTIDDQGNLVGENLVNGNDLQLGSQYFNNNTWHNNNLISVIPNQQYYIYQTTYSVQSRGFWVGYYNENKQLLSQERIFTELITIPSNAYYFRFGYLVAYYGAIYNQDIMMSRGSERKPYEPYGVWYSQENYDIANDNRNSFYYNTFNGSKSLIYPQGTTWYQQGSISQLYSAYMNEPTTAELPYTYSLNRTDTSFTMKSYPTTQDETDLFDDNPRGTILFIPNTYISYPIYVGLNDITFNYSLQVLYLDNTSIVIDTDNLQPHLYIAKVESSFDNPIIAISYDYYYEDYFLNTNISIDTAGLNINDYYQRGYDSARATYGATVQQQLRDIEDLNNQIDTLNNTIDSWKSRYNDLASQNTELSMRNLMWYIASTPFESFKSIWNVDFLGLNISAFFTGMFSIFIIIWILKKIF